MDRPKIKARLEAIKKLPKNKQIKIVFLNNAMHEDYRIGKIIGDPFTAGFLTMAGGWEYEQSSPRHDPSWSINFQYLLDFGKIKKTMVTQIRIDKIINIESENI